MIRSGFRRDRTDDGSVDDAKGFDAFDLRLGDLMRGERATLGKSLLDVQRELKIKAAYIAAIENADPTAFDTPGFIAGYVRSYARYLGMDPDWAFETFCAESGFATAHGMSDAASTVKAREREVVRKQQSDERFLSATTPFTPRGEGLFSRIEPGAFGSVLVLVALIALFKDDLKALLAFSTVSHLGLLTMLLGFGTPFAAVVAVFHIINHLTFKAALFMTAGIIDHETHTRDIKRLGGLRHLMPITFAIGTAAALSMAGIPFFNGFLSKEMMLDAASDTVWAVSDWAVPVLSTLGALLSVAYSLRFIVHVFFGPVRDDYPAKPHDPPLGLWIAPALLVAMVIAIGLVPTLVGPLVASAGAAVIGGELPYYSLKIWHGVNAALIMSIIAVAGGIVLLALHRVLDRVWIAAPRPEAKAIFDRLIAAAVALSRALSDGLHNGAMGRYLAVFVAVSVALGIAAFTGGGLAAPSREMLPVPPVILVGWLMLVVATVSVVTMHHHRFRALVLIGIIGLTISSGFVYLSAPDLALTQISVETVTIMLLLLALHFLPKSTPRESRGGRKLRDGLIALAAGGGVGALAYAFMLRDVSTISDYHLANSYEGGGGTNVVNVILVDFRGYDTYGEIIVLGIAGFVIYALMQALLDGPAARRLRNRDYSQDRSRDRHPLMMVVVTRVLMPIAVVVGIYIFLRGHNQPGGGFVAGLVIAIALLMHYMASGFAWTQARKRIEYHTMIGIGALIAGLTGAAAWLYDAPFLTSLYGYVELPPIERFGIGTAFLFDLGVFLTVLGAVMLMLYSLSRIARYAGETVNLAPMDYDPGAAAAAAAEAEAEAEAAGNPGKAEG